MADSVLPKPEPEAYDALLRRQALSLRGKDRPPADRKAWELQRAALREKLFAAMGPMPEQPCPLDPRPCGVIERDGYRIEKLLLRTRPDVWMTASLYIPEPVRGKHPAVLVVHGHWPWARRDPVVQARCLGLVKLGFVVLAVDAFGAGERFTEPARGTYHGALYGSTLWPTGLTLLGVQVYDNRRAVDYLVSRPEVDGERLGITGASGGGNQTMYAGALDERFKAAVPVCSIGTYQAYLHAACCVCEVLPGALRFAEEGDVLSLVAPRGLMVVSATRDGFQFSVGEARKSVARAGAVFQMLGAGDRIKHAIFESGHDYSRPMREAMYGWMTRFLKGEGDGSPVPEPAHMVEEPDALRCLTADTRPRTFLYPPTLAGREGRRLVEEHGRLRVDHPEAWEAQAMLMRSRLRDDVFGPFPGPGRQPARVSGPKAEGEHTRRTAVLYPEPEMPLPVILDVPTGAKGPVPVAVLLHLDGKEAALSHPLAAALRERLLAVAVMDLRATGETRPGRDGIRDAPDHNSAEHGLWVGRPLLGQWVFDVGVLLDWLAGRPELDKSKVHLVGLEQAALVAICASGSYHDRVGRVALIEPPVTLVTDQPYPSGTRMGLLAPGLLRVGDVPHLAGLTAPRHLLIAGGRNPQGERMSMQQVTIAFAFTRHLYTNGLRLPKRLTILEPTGLAEVATGLTA